MNRSCAYLQYRWQRFTAVLLMRLLSLYGARVHRRNPDGKDNLPLHSSTVAITPNSFKGWNDLGEAQWQQGRLDDAIASFRRAAALFPTYERVHDNLGALHFLRGEVQAALAELQVPIALDPRDAGARSNPALAYLKAGRKDLAVAELHRALTIEPRNPLIRAALQRVTGRDPPAGSGAKPEGMR